LNTFKERSSALRVMLTAADAANGTLQRANTRARTSGLFFKNSAAERPAFF
jgi:hypothetical protein